MEDFMAEASRNIQAQMDAKQHAQDVSVLANEILLDGKASIVGEQIMERVREFEKYIDSDADGKAVGFVLVGLAGLVTMRVVQIRALDPYLLVFSGFEISSNSLVELVQNVSQVSVLFKLVDQPEKKERNPIGFAIGNNA